MSYLRNWEVILIPEKEPYVLRSCPKCREKKRYYSSGKFRINANKSKVDVWLIYQCEKCSSTWNLTIYERISPQQIPAEEYEKYLANDDELAREVSCDQSIHHRNRSEFYFDRQNCRVSPIVSTNETADTEGVQILKIKAPYPTDMRLDKILSQCLNISRSQVEKMHKDGRFPGADKKGFLKQKVKAAMEVRIMMNL